VRVLVREAIEQGGSFVRRAVVNEDNFKLPTRHRLAQ